MLLCLRFDPQPTLQFVVAALPASHGTLRKRAIAGHIGVRVVPMTCQNTTWRVGTQQGSYSG